MIHNDGITVVGVELENHHMFHIHTHKKPQIRYSVDDLSISSYIKHLYWGGHWKLL